MKSHLCAVVLVAIVAVTSCSEPPAAPQQPAPAPQAEAVAPAQISRENQGVLTDTQREGLNAANQMSSALEDAEKKRREQMEAQGI